MDFAKCYYEMATEHIIKCKPDVVGHFDVINKFSLMPEEDEKYQEIAVESAREILKTCKVFELNKAIEGMLFKVRHLVEVEEVK